MRHEGCPHPEWTNQPGEPLHCAACAEPWPGEPLPEPVRVDNRPDWLRV